jgi:hypothetical protein
MKITKYRPINKGTILGSASISRDGWFTNELTVFQKNDRRWVNMPSRPYEVNGEKRYLALHGAESKEDYDVFQKEFFLLLDEYLANEDQTQPTPNEEMPF